MFETNVTEVSPAKSISKQLKRLRPFLLRSTKYIPVSLMIDMNDPNEEDE